MRKRKDQNEITAVMDIKGIKYSDIGEALGVSGACVRDWVIGKVNPRKKYMEPLANALGVSDTFIQEQLVFVDKYKKRGNIGGTRAATTFKNNFWSSRRVECNMRLREVAEAVNKPMKKVAMYFSGQLLPDDEVISKICGLFDVDFIAGKSQFYKAHREYKAEQKRKLIKSAKKPKEVKTVKAVKEKNIEPAVKETKVKEPEVREEIGRYSKLADVLYGHISYEDFNKIMDVRNVDNPDKILKSLYGKIDYKVYTQVYAILIENV